ncbi:MAG: alpha-L-fucosidase [Planctomycetes bacterium GWF2_42_9]|nr:MAG: alpha-L-fucosidase [Planctomycetes bacterium GWF2_42_9]
MAIPVPLPYIERFEKLAYGMFVHWGLYSQLGRGEWVKFIEKIPTPEYKKLKETFTAEKFNAKEIACLAKDAGMRYICLTTRHHEGFSLYDTRGLSDFDAVHSPAGRDLVAEFVEGCRLYDIIPFFYHTTLDWHQESYQKDFESYLDYLHKSVEILCTNYGRIGGLWFDGNWNKPDADWKESRLYEIIRKHQPEAMIVNNTGLFEQGRVGHPEIDSITFEQGTPSPMNRQGMPKYLAAEMSQTMNRHWGVGNNDFCYLSPKEIIENLCACRKVGANLLLNVGPTAQGQIPEYEVAALRRVGQWVKLNALPIYNGKPYQVHSTDNDFALKAEGKLYLFIRNLNIAGPSNVTLGEKCDTAKAFLGIKQRIKSCRWLDNNEPLSFTQNEDGLFCINATAFNYGSHLVIRVAEVELA